MQQAAEHHEQLHVQVRQAVLRAAQVLRDARLQVRLQVGGQGHPGAAESAGSRREVAENIDT